MTEEQFKALLQLLGDTTVALQDVAAAMEKKAETDQAMATALQDLVALLEKQQR